MPYRNYKKKYTRPGYKSCGKMVFGDAKKALAIASSLKRLVNVEIKNFDVQQTAIGVANVPVIVQLSNIPQGDTTITRDGAQCKVLSLELSLRIVLNTSAVATVVRFLLVCDKQTNQAIYLNTDLMEDISANDALVSPYNLDNKYRFQVLWDRTFVLSSATGNRTFKRIFRMNKLLRFDGSTPSIADLTSNSYSLVQFSNEATNTPAVTMFSRLRYVDN